MPAIVVLVKNVPDTWSTKTLEADHTVDRDSVDCILDEVNEYAVEAALRLRDDNPDAGLKVIALTVGPQQADNALRKALAMGADDAIHVVDDALAGSDALATAWTVTCALATIPDVTLVVAGDASSDGAVGALPGILGEYRQQPALTAVHDVALDGTEITATREDAHGTYRLRAALPAIVSVTDKSAKPRFANFKGIMAAKKHEITTLSLAAIGVTAEQVGLEHAASVVTGATPRPARAAGTTISGGDAAQRVAEFLSDEKLI